MQELRYAQMTPHSLAHALLLVHIGSEEGNSVVSVTNEGRATSSKVVADFFKIGNLSFKYPSNHGLGLYLCQDFVARHNGEIWATPLLDGKGMTFSFSLPRK